MTEIDILEKNPNKLIALLTNVISKPELKKIANVSNKHCRMLIKLSLHHLNFAVKISSRKDWRQKISRAYYCCYNASKAIRLNAYGEYNQEGSDHQKIGNLPGSFPNSNIWANFLNQFRSDRNLADYDHEKMCSELHLSPSMYIDKSKQFYKISIAYLKSRGVL